MKMPIDLLSIGLIAIGILIMAVAFGAIISLTHIDEPLAVTRQAGFRIDVDNSVMLEARLYHNTGRNGIFWDVTNDTFMFSRDGHNCFVFTADFKKYLDDKEYQKE
jgi:hypothetical protein